MIPVVTPEEMGRIDAEAPEPVDVLVRRAAGALARHATAILGGTYGRRVVVVAGPGNNGADGRVAGALLSARGVRVTVLEALDAPRTLPASDLVLDAAFGTGFRGEYDFPDPNGAPVLAVDIASGLSGLTGTALGSPVAAVGTVTFAALKPGLVLGSGPALSGRVAVADIGLDVGRARAALITDADVAAWVPERGDADHKWRHAVRVIAGSPGMSGAAWMCAAAALRGGAGYVQLSTPGDPHPSAPREAVAVPLGDAFAAEVLADAERFAAVVVGPGLGRDPGTAAEVRQLVERCPVPVLVDGDGLHALAADPARRVAGRSAATVLTPHDGEFAALTGSSPGPDRMAAARALAADSGAVVLLKGPTTVVADPNGDALLVRNGDARLATAGTGDVLSGLVAAHLALGAEPTRAAASAAHVHGGAALLGARRGLVASDLLELVPRWWERHAPR